MFGPHLILDCYGCPHERLTDVELVYNALEDCPDEIGMTKIMPPYVFRYKGVVPEEWGVSGVVLIAESHITIHTFPEKGYMSVDVFSCKPFDVDRALEFMRNRFHPEKIDHRVLGRGMEYPRDMERVEQIVRCERTDVAPGILASIEEVG
ncbi:MAG TPA: adenosylmethionine decarboxylase [Armatimonadota bacterium]